MGILIQYRMLIKMAKKLFRNDIIVAANKSTALPVLVDKTTHISGIQQLSLRIHFM